MNAPSIIIISLVLIIAIFIIYRLIAVRIARNKKMQRDLERLKALIDKLEGVGEITVADVYPFAADLLTRKNTFLLLRERDKTNLFPEEFNTIDKGAESDLANWLEFPTELGSCPSEIEHLKKVMIDFDGNNVIYQVYKFRINEPHWAAKTGWMLGVAGPFFDDSKPYDRSSATFSNLKKMETTTPEAEVEWVHKNISMRSK